MNKSRHWSDLSQDIVGLIINKLRFPDQIRALAVCKSWRDCKDRVRCSDTLPWVLNYGFVNFVIGEFFNPYLQEVHKVASSINFRKFHYLKPLASKHGWLLFHGGPFSETLLLYHPFTNDTQWVPTPRGWSFNRMATINVDPISHEFEIFMLANRDDHLCIDSYKAGGLTSELIFETSKHEEFRSVLYMKGSIYCLFLSGNLYCYSLEDKSWKLLTSRIPEPRAARDVARQYWLLEIKENLVMVVAEPVEEVRKLIRIFWFDWSEMSWVVEPGLKSCAIYICDKIAFSAPLQNRDGEKLEGCKVFYLNNDLAEFKCYSMSEATGVEIQCEEYSWISKVTSYDLSFIEPPYFGI